MPKQQRYNSTQIMNQSMEQQNTAEVSFENNIVSRNCQGDVSGILNYQSDNSKNDIRSTEVMFHPRSQELLEKGKMLLKEKSIYEAIE